MRKFVVLLATLAALVVTPAAVAAPPVSVIGGNLNCGVVTADGNVAGATGQTWCGSQSGSITSTVVPALPVARSTVASPVDGTPLDVNFALPDDGTAAPYPTVMMFHGYGGSKTKFDSSQLQKWLGKGYAVYSITQRGFGESCRSAGSQAADPAGCANGYVHLIDARYEVRDTQDFIGKLVDDGMVQPGKIAATGGSYGGGMSMSLAALKNRVINMDNSLSPWRSPVGNTPISLAVATPNIPWSDLSDSLVPNGSNIDYLKDAPYVGRVGVMKESYIQGLSLSGRNAPIGTDPQADILGWKALLDAGEPYDSNPAAAAMVTEISGFHSSYGLDHSAAPAPLMISSGFTDDLFPVNEATRFYNRSRAQFPNSPLALFFGSFGHARGQNKSTVTSALSDLTTKWIDHYLGGVGPAPASNVTTFTQTCPSGDATLDGGPYKAGDWASISPGEIRHQDAGGAQTVAADGGDPAVSSVFNPLGSGDPCAAAPGAKETGTANYELDPAPAGGYTIMGAPTVVAKISLPGNSSQVAARLVDVSPDGTKKTLVARGLWRPTQSGFQVFQLFANGWKVEPGHVIRLELLAKDAAGAAGGFLSNYARPSNGQQDATFKKLDLRVPVLESPGALGGLVTAPAKKVLPDRAGVQLAKGYNRIGSVTLTQYKNGVGSLEVKGKPKVKGKKLTAKVSCDKKFERCKKTTIKFKSVSKGKKGLVAKKGGIQVGSGKTRNVKFKLTNKGRKVFKNNKKTKTKVLVNGKKSGKINVKRTGKVK
ncbi:MAG: acetylxylan esterase [Thermoleophilia bacterium]|nr:acetylxylan esterase [Thermoleophilia bacterium]